MPPDGWNEWSKHVLKELERLSKAYTDSAKELGKIRVEIAVLKVKAGIWGLLGGAIPVGVGLLVYLLKEMK